MNLALPYMLSFIPIRLYYVYENLGVIKLYTHIAAATETAASQPNV